MPGTGPFVSPIMSRVSGKPYFVYVLWSLSGHRFYIGISEDPRVRLLQHNSGVSTWTKYRANRIDLEKLPGSRRESLAALGTNLGQKSIFFLSTISGPLVGELFGSHPDSSR